MLATFLKLRINGYNLSRKSCILRIVIAAHIINPVKSNEFKSMAVENRIKRKEYGNKRIELKCRIRYGLH